MMEGNILGNRYQLIEKVGGGGMALVFKARDMLLNRYVALKILRPEFTDDNEIVLRFKAEAQSAAGLSHPNIVSIYDVGEDRGIYYIVMEYIDGVTLRQSLDRNGSIAFKDIVNVGIQIAAALDHAHKNKIIHRDIKSQNIMITSEGVIKVTDFGIARAANTASTLTNLGNAIGSVHYFSPEQAKGGYVDSRSDIYSLGITLYEMTTGNVPFDADSPISVALQHLNQPATPPVSVRSEIPVGLNDIIMKAIRKDPNHRYQSATDISADLMFALNHPHMPISDEREEKDKTKKYNRLKEDLEKNNSVPDRKKTLNKTVLILICTAVGLALFFALVFGIPAIIGDNNLRRDGGTHTGEPVESFTVENYIGEQAEEIKAQLSVSYPWLDIEEVLQVDAEEKKGTVLEQIPAEGAVLLNDDTGVLILTVCSGKEKVSIPAYKNIHPDEYEKILSDKKLKSKRSEEYSDSVPEGEIVRVSPESGKSVSVGSTVTIYISLGVEIKQYPIPNIVGKTYKDAKTLLKAQGFSVGTVTPQGSNLNNYIVKSQFPKAAVNAESGTSVDIVLDTYTQKSFRINIDQTLYYFPVSVRVETTPSDTGITETKYINDSCKKNAFPILIPDIMVPIGGSTEIRVYVNGELEQTHPIKWND